jgi:hypothetical protein
MLPLALALLLVAPAAQRQPDATRETPKPRPCDNTILHEPVLVYQITGSTLLGATDLELIVNSNGIVRLSSAIRGRSQMAFLGVTTTNALVRRLAAAGGSTLCDQDVHYSDLPVHTLTLVREGFDDEAHSVSWFAAEGPMVAIQMELQTLIVELFPEF